MAWHMITECHEHRCQIGDFCCNCYEYGAHSVCLHHCGLWVAPVCNSSTNPAVHSLVHVHGPAVDLPMQNDPWKDMANDMHADCLKRSR